MSTWRWGKNTKPTYIILFLNIFNYHSIFLGDIFIQLWRAFSYVMGGLRTNSKWLGAKKALGLGLKPAHYALLFNRWFREVH